MDRTKPGKLKTTSVSLTAVILLCLIVEILVDYYVTANISLSWSYVVAGSIVPVIIFLILLSGNKMQDELIKKLHI